MERAQRSDRHLFWIVAGVVWLVLLLVHQLGLFDRTMQQLRAGWIAVDEESLSFASRLAVDAIRSGDCDGGLAALDGVALGSEHAPSWIRIEAIDCLEREGRAAEAMELVRLHCSELPPGDAGSVRAVNRAAPEYPDRAVEVGAAGFTQVAFDIDEEGRVFDVRILESKPPGFFDEVSYAAVAGWRYCPGEPHRDLTVRLDFTLDPPAE